MGDSMADVVHDGPAVLSMPSGDRSVLAAFSRRVTTALLVRQIIRFSAAGCIVLAVGVLVLRVAFHWTSGALLWTLMLLAPLAGAAVVSAFRARPRQWQLLAELDRLNRCGGLLLAGQEVDLLNWRADVKLLPALRWRAGRPLIMLCGAAIFLAGAFAMPEKATVRQGGQLMIGRQADDLLRQIEALKKEDIIKPQQAGQIAAMVKDLKQQSSGEDPARTFEALEHLQRQLQQAAADAAQKAASDAQKASAAQGVAQALSEAGSKMAASDSAEAMKALSQLALQLAKENSLLEQSMSDELQAACEQSAAGNAQLSSEQMQDLAEALGESAAGLEGMLGRMAAAGTIDPELLRQCRAAMAGRMLSDAELAQLADAMCEACKDGLEPGELAGLVGCSGLARGDDGDGSPGKGGINRGRGDAGLALNNETDTQNAKFEKKMVTPASAAAMKEHRLMGISQGAPTVSAKGEDDTHGALAGAGTGAGSAAAQVILPQHRQAVADYFQRRKGTPATSPR